MVSSDLACVETGISRSQHMICRGSDRGVGYWNGNSALAVRPADSNKACASVAAITSVVNLVVALHRQEKCVCACVSVCRRSHTLARREAWPTSWCVTGWSSSSTDPALSTRTCIDHTCDVNLGELDTSQECAEKKTLRSVEHKRIVRTKDR